MLEEKVTFETRDLDKQRLSVAELDQLIGERDYQQFLNPRNELFRKWKMKEHPPSRSEAVKLMAKEPNLIRRPLLVQGEEIILGFDEEAYRRL